MNDPILEYRLKQLEERIGDYCFLKTKVPAMRLASGSLTIRQSKSFRSANIFTFYSKNWIKSIPIKR